MHMRIVTTVLNMLQYSPHFPRPWNRSPPKQSPESNVVSYGFSHVMTRKIPLATKIATLAKTEIMILDLTTDSQQASRSLPTGPSSLIHGTEFHPFR